jgi:hypothetical protein
LVGTVLPPRGIFVLAGFFGGTLLLLVEYDVLVFIFAVGIEDLDGLEDCTIEDGSVLLGSNALGANLAFPSESEDVTVGGDGVKDLDALEDELDVF